MIQKGQSMKYEDTLEIDEELRNAVTADVAKAHPWLRDEELTPDLHTLAAHVVTDLERRAVKLCAFSTSPTARNLADELSASAARLRAQMYRRPQATSAAVYDYAREIALAMSNLAMGCHALRAPLMGEPELPGATERVADRAPPKRMGGRPKTKVERVPAPWERYLIKPPPGRPPRDFRMPPTEEANVKQAQLQWINAETKAGRKVDLAAYGIAMPKRPKTKRTDGGGKF